MTLYTSVAPNPRLGWFARMMARPSAVASAS
ncbi:hypothetical protein BH11PSE2_BH11PSE2_18780 [soil metagenome]